jgi:hypothetical protein
MRQFIPGQWGPASRGLKRRDSYLVPNDRADLLEVAPVVFVSPDHGRRARRERLDSRVLLAFAGRSTNSMVPSPAVPSRPVTALRHSPIPALRKLAIEETNTEVVLIGSVSSYYLKQLAQEAVLPLLEGRELRNRVQVVEPQSALVNSQ